MPNNKDISEGKLVQKGLQLELNKNGFSFQFAVVKKIQELNNQNELAKIYPIATEVPVGINGENTHIDIVLARSKPHTQPANSIYLISECKRANPALSNWCFVKSPFTRNQGLANSLILEVIHWGANDGHKAFDFRANAQIIPTSKTDFYHIFHEIKSDKKGDATGTSRGVIEKATSQVFRGLNGFVNFMMKNPHLLKNEKTTYLLPVIFTTAQIWTSEINLSKANIENGNLIIEEKELERKNWILFEYNQSPNLKHLFPMIPRREELSLTIEAEFSRTIAVVNTKGIEEFIYWVSNLNLPSL